MTRAAIVTVAAAMFFVLAGTGVASALWSTRATVTVQAKVANLSDSCTPSGQVSIDNGSFEQPDTGTGAGVTRVRGSGSTASGGMPGWQAKRNSDNSVTDIEIWRNGASFDGLPAVSTSVGKQFVELNATVAGTLFQNVATQQAGLAMQWSLLHRGRLGTDTLQLSIGSPAAPVVQRVISTGNGVAEGTNGWVRYSGAYVVPANQSVTQLSFTAVSAAGNDVTKGNLLDDVVFGSSPCIRATSTVSNAAPMAGQTITYTTTVENTGGSPTAVTSLAWDVPAGLAYVAGSLRVNAVSGGTVTGARIFAPLGAGATSTVGGSLSRGASSVVAFDAVVDAPTSARLAYTPTISHSNILAPGWVRTGTPVDAPIVVAAPRADLAVSARVSAPTVARDRPVTWTFDVRNAGPSPSSGVAVRLDVSTALKSVLAGGPAMTCSAVSASGRVDCAFSSVLAPNETRTVTLTASAPSNALTFDRYSATATVSASTPDPASQNNTASAATVADATPPNPPRNLGANSGSTSIMLAWSAPQYAAADVAFYDVYRGGRLVGTVTAPTVSFTDTGLARYSTYEYAVVARDAAGNTSTSIGGTARTN